MASSQQEASTQAASAASRLTMFSCQASHVKNSADGERGYQYSRREVDNANMWDRHTNWLDSSVPPPNEYPFNHIDPQQHTSHTELELLQRRDSAPPPYLLAQHDRLVRPPSYDTLVLLAATPPDSTALDCKDVRDKPLLGSR